MYKLSGLSDMETKQAANDRTKQEMKICYKIQQRVAHRGLNETESGNGESSAAADSSAPAQS